MTEQQLKKYIENKKYTKKIFKQFWQSNLEKRDFLQKQFQKNNRGLTLFIFVKYYYGGLLDKKCLACGKLLSVEAIRRDRTFCSYQCSTNKQIIIKRNLQKYGVQFPQQLPQFKQKLKKINLQKYGVQSNLQLSSFKQKSRKTCLQKYGTEYITQSDYFKDKSKQTTKQKYGVQFAMQNKQIRNKHKKTMFERYGEEHALNCQQFKNKCHQTNIERYGYNYRQQFVKKAKQTTLQRYGQQSVFLIPQFKQMIKNIFLEKYGVDQPLKSKQIREKMKTTNLQRYGCENPLFNEQVKQKRKNSNLQRYGSQHYVQSQKFKKQNKIRLFNMVINRVKQYQVQPLFGVQQYNGYYKHIYKWKCLKCENVFQQCLSNLIINGALIENIARCPICYPFVSGFSYLQKQVVKFVKEQLKYNVVQSDTNIITPYQLDLYILQKNVGIQFNGLYWHSDQKNPNDYHLMKTQMCLEKGIQLVHIFQDEWLNKQDIVKDRIKNIIGIYDNRVFARKCTIKQISFDVCKQFLDYNHIQGSDNSKIRLGLFYNDQLISVMTFSKPRFNTNYEYELVRFASKLCCQVVGGASKLLKYFQRNYNPKNIISYADRRYSNGKLYYALGFQFLNNSDPNYWWVKNRQKYTRYQCQKHKLKQLLGQDKFDQNLSESQNMYLNGYNKIYDCGNMIFVKQY